MKYEEVEKNKPLTLEDFRSEKPKATMLKFLETENMKIAGALPDDYYIVVDCEEEPQTVLDNPNDFVALMNLRTQYVAWYFITRKVNTVNYELRILGAEK